MAKGTAQEREATTPPVMQSPSLLPIPVGVVTGLIAICIFLLAPETAPIVPARFLMLPPLALFFAAGLLCQRFTKTLTAGALAGAIAGFLGGMGHTIANTIPVLNEVAQRVNEPLAGLMLLFLSAMLSSLLYMCVGAFFGLLGTLAGMGLARLRQRA